MNQNFIWNRQVLCTTELWTVQVSWNQKPAHEEQVLDEPEEIQGTEEEKIIDDVPEPEDRVGESLREPPGGSWTNWTWAKEIRAMHGQALV